MARFNSAQSSGGRNAGATAIMAMATAGATATAAVALLAAAGPIAATVAVRRMALSVALSGTRAVLRSALRGTTAAAAGAAATSATATTTRGAIGAAFAATLGRLGPVAGNRCAARQLRCAGFRSGGAEETFDPAKEAGGFLGGGWFAGDRCGLGRSRGVRRRALLVARLLLLA